MKLKVTQVAIGQLTIEGLTDGQGNFYVSARQVAEQFQLLPNNAVRDLKRLHSKGSNYFHSLTIDGQKDKSSVLTLIGYQESVKALALSGNTEAINFVNLLFGLSLHQLFCDAFGIKFEADERQALLNERQLAREQFHPLFTTHCKADGCNSGLDYVKRVAQLKAASGLPGNLSCNDMGTQQLQKLTSGEIRYDSLRRLANFTHQQAIKAMKAL